MTDRKYIPVHPVTGRELFAELLRDFYKDHVYPKIPPLFTEEMIARAADYAHKEGTGTYAEYAGEMVIGTDFGDQPGTTVYQVFEKRGDTIVAKGLIRETNGMMECAAGHKLDLRTAPLHFAHQDPLFRKNAFVRDHAECTGVSQTLAEKNNMQVMEAALDRVVIQLDRARDEGNGDSFDTVEQLVDRYIQLVHPSFNRPPPAAAPWLEPDRHPVLSNSEARVASLEIQLRAVRESLAIRDEQLKDAKEDLAHTERARADLADKLAASFKLTVDLRAEVMNLKAAHFLRVEEIAKLENTLGEVIDSRLGIKPELQVGIQDMSGDDL